MTNYPRDMVGYGSQPPDAHLVPVTHVAAPFDRLARHNLCDAERSRPGRRLPPSLCRAWRQH